MVLVQHIAMLLKLKVFPVLANSGAFEDRNDLGAANRRAREAHRRPECLRCSRYRCCRSQIGSPVQQMTVLSRLSELSPPKPPSRVPDGPQQNYLMDGPHDSHWVTRGPMGFPWNSMERPPGPMGWVPIGLHSAPMGHGSWVPWAP